MAEFSGPFDGSPIATQEQWSAMAKRWGLDGVHAADPTDTSLKVTGSGVATVAVAPGRASVNGFYYDLDAVKNLAVPANAGSSARVDLAILRADPLSAHSVVAAYKTGGTAPPALTQDVDGVWEIPLAQCTVAAGSSVVVAANVADRRWFTDRGVMPSVPGARRPSVKGQLLVEGSSIYIGDGVDWRWLASAGIEDSSYTPIWTAGSTTINWGSGTQNVGRFQVVGKRVDVTIHLVPGGNPPAYDDVIQVTLPPGYPCTSLTRSLFTWNYTSGNGEGSAVGVAMCFPTESTTKIARLRFPVADGNTSTATPNTFSLLTNDPFNIRTGDVLTIDGSYWLA